MLIRVGQLNLTFDPPVPFSPSHLRGAVAGTWPEQSLLHQHEHEDVPGSQRSLGPGRLNYVYPRVRYGIGNNSTGVITALEEGVPVLEELEQRLSHREVRLGSRGTKIVGSTFEKQEGNFGCPDAPSATIPYGFLSPWLALNEENYARYQASGPAKRRRLLERILIGNILSMSKGLGYVVTQEIKVSRLDVYPVRAPVRLKGIEMTGFKGAFAVNFELPDLIGLGKSVSRGFGTVRRALE